MFKNGVYDGVGARTNAVGGAYSARVFETLVLDNVVDLTDFQIDEKYLTH